MDHAETTRLYRLYKEGNIEARNKLIESVDSIVRLTGKRYKYKAYYEDIISESYWLIITEYLDKWNPERGEFYRYIRFKLWHNVLNSLQIKQLYIFDPELVIDEPKTNNRLGCLADVQEILLHENAIDSEIFIKHYGLFGYKRHIIEDLSIEYSISKHNIRKLIRTIKNKFGTNKCIICKKIICTDALYCGTYCCNKHYMVKTCLQKSR